MIPALRRNKSLEYLSLRGNSLEDSGAVGFGKLLSENVPPLKSLDLGSCRIRDDGGVALAKGLVENTILEVLLLRDNSVSDASGKAFEELLLGTNNVLLRLSLELNGAMDYKYVSSIARLIERNRRLRKESLPARYRKRISELKDAETERENLAGQMAENATRKKEAQEHEAETRRSLRKLVHREAEKQRKLEERLAAVRERRALMEKKCGEIEEEVAEKTSHGEFAVQQLRSQVDNVCAQIERRTKQISRVSNQIRKFDQDAEEEVGSLTLERAARVKKRDEAQQLTAAAQRNLDSYIASLRAMSEDSSLTAAGGGGTAAAGAGGGSAGAAGAGAGAAAGAGAKAKEKAKGKAKAKGKK